MLRLMPSQWETVLQCNAISHRLREHTEWSLSNTLLERQWSVGLCKIDVTPLLTHWSYVFLALTHRYETGSFRQPSLSISNYDADCCLVISRARFLSTARFRPMREKALLEASCILHSILWICTWRSETWSFLCTRWFHAINAVTHIHDDVIQWKHFPGYWPFVRGIHPGILMFSLICAWINGWVNNGEAGDLRRHRTHYEVTVMCCKYHTLHNDTLTPASHLLAWQLRVYCTPTSLDYRLQWRHMSVIASQVTGNSGDCSTCLS